MWAGLWRHCARRIWSHRRDSRPDPDAPQRPADRRPKHLIAAIDEEAEAAVLDNLHPRVTALGRFNDQLYGLPYNVEVQHIAYQDGLYTPDGWDFAGVLEEDMAFVFPAGRATSLSDVFLAQYRSTTATLDSAALNIDADQLRALFEFYEQAVSERHPIVLEYILPDDYRSGLITGDVPAGV